MENLYPKHGLISRTYYKKSLIMASIVGFKSKFFMIMSLFILSVRLTASPVANSAIKMSMNLGKSLRTSLSTTMRVRMTRKNSLNQSRLFLHLKASQTRPSPQPQALGTTFQARVRDYMAAHSERMERFENAIFKQREDINDRMTEMFRLLKELTTSRAHEKVLIREETKFPITKNVNSISLARGEEERSDKTDETLDNTKKPTITKMEIPVMEAKRSNETKNKPIKRLKGNKWKSIGGLKHVNALVDQGSDVNVMPYSTYMKLTNEMPTETYIRLSLASHSYIYPLGIVKDVLVEVTEHVYPIDFVILDIKENKKRPFILGTSFLTTAKAAVKFDKGTITLRSGNSKISFHRASLGIGRKDKASFGKGMEFNQRMSKNFKGKHPTLITTRKEWKMKENSRKLYLMRRSLEVIRKFH
ncbi:MAK10-like protein [Tanacetum coccineum]